MVRTTEESAFSFEQMKYRYKWALNRMGGPPCNSVLDIGCGEAHGFGILKGPRYFPAHGYVKDYTGVDSSESALEKAWLRYASGKFIKQKVPPLPDFKEKFDYVICFELVEHLPPEDVPKLLSEIRDVLKPNGRLFISSPRAETNGGFMPDCHIKEYTVRELKDLIGTARFRIIEERGMSYHDPEKKIGLHPKARGHKPKVFNKKNKNPLVRLAIKLKAKWIIWLGYLFPKKSRYQIYVCERIAGEKDV